MNKTAPKILYLCYLLSGFSALTYEILWSKQLSLTYGTTLPALSVVTGTYMAGLAIGNWFFGRRADSSGSPLKLYAMIEAGIALTAFMVPLVLPFLSNIYVSMYQTGILSEATAHLARFVFSALLLLPTTILVGGTLPVMCRIATAGQTNIRFGWLYAINTLGAVTGCLAAAYLLIPMYGLSISNWTAVSINGSIAIACFLLKTQSKTKKANNDNPADIQASPPGITTIILTCVALQGSFALAYEILWTRVFILYLGNTTFAFATMLAAFLIGLSIGSCIYSSWLKSISDQRQLFFWLFFLSGISVLVTVPFYDWLFFLFDSIYVSLSDNWGLLTAMLFIVVTLTIFVPTILSGAILPTALGILAPTEDTLGRSSGQVLFYNTLGAITGSIAGGFLLIPQFGVLGSFRFIAAINLIIALAYGATKLSGFRKKELVKVTACIILVFTCSYKQWDQILVNSGTYLYSQHFISTDGMGPALATQKLLHLGEGNDATVALVEDTTDGTRAIKVNGKADGSNSAKDMAMQILLGQLPALVHESPENALVIGLGTGITLKQLVLHSVPAIDSLEISTEVVETALMFDEGNQQVFEHPSVNMVIADGRNWLLTRQKSYDLIVSEPSNPWQSGNANLFTHEFYQLVKQRLSPNGIFCQWFPLYDLPPEYVHVALKTILQSFAHLRIFIVNQSEIIILGTATPLPWNEDKVNSRMTNSEIASILSTLNINSASDITGQYYFCDEWPIKALVDEANINTDTKPILEFARPAVRSDWDMINMQQLLKVRSAYDRFRAQRAVQ